MKDFRCELFPLILQPHTYNASGIPSDNAAPIEYQATRDNIHFEFRKDTSMSIFGVYNTSGGPQIYRQEYVKFNFFSFWDDARSHHFIMGPYDSFTWLTPNTLAANLTYKNLNRNSVMLVSQIWQFDASVANKAALKFSVEITSAQFHQCTQLRAPDLGPVFRL